ncbi:hypothetical protein DUI87_15668 [Hirundo rustica rustica]|uniref:Uncharacterized protein n=1 Tax=Hirundo rustica rustica TaxID=333673 RepID=A0A3M0KGI8_HIRRU|nr:hypothetical protein DUI87_15668 [Hirundo rustica rustica]
MEGDLGRDPGLGRAEQKQPHRQFGLTRMHTRIQSAWEPRTGPSASSVASPVLEQGISSLDLLASPSGCSPESCQPSLTQGHFAGPCSALATQLWHTSLSSQSGVIGILIEDKLCPIIQTMNEDVKQD